MIEAPGIYPDFPTIDYYADPCPAPSLTQSVAKVLLDRSPLHAWYQHPRLNPDYRPDDDTKFDIGNIAHALMIGRGKAITVLDFDDWRTKAAKEERDAAAAKGKLAILGKHHARAEKMVAAAREQLELRGMGHLFRDGNGEVVLAWQEDEPRGPIWMRQMVDWLSADRRIFCDFKTTELSAAPHNLSRMMVNAGWDVQAAFAERGLGTLDPDNAGRRRFLFVVQEAVPPYCLSVVELGEAALTMGRKRVAMAMDTWARCIKADRWPGYPQDIVRPEFPAWAESAWLEREVQQDKRVPSDILMAG